MYVHVLWECVHVLICNVLCLYMFRCECMFFCVCVQVYVCARELMGVHLYAYVFAYVCMRTRAHTCMTI